MLYPAHRNSPLTPWPPDPGPAPAQTQCLGRRLWVEEPVSAACYWDSSPGQCSCCYFFNLCNLGQAEAVCPHPAGLWPPQATSGWLSSDLLGSSKDQETPSSWHRGWGSGPSAPPRRVPLSVNNPTIPPGWLLTFPPTTTPFPIPGPLHEPPLWNLPPPDRAPSVSQVLIWTGSFQEAPSSP